MKALQTLLNVLQEWYQGIYTGIYGVFQLAASLYGYLSQAIKNALAPAIALVVMAATVIFNAGSMLVEGLLESSVSQQALASIAKEETVYNFVQDGIGLLNCFVPISLICDAIVTLSFMWIVCTTIRLIKSWIPTMG